jgi:hypothetical protein
MSSEPTGRILLKAELFMKRGRKNLTDIGQILPAIQANN